MNPITDAIPAALDPTTWDWAGKVVLPISLALLSGAGRYVFLNATKLPSKKLTDLLELKAQVPETDHKYLEPAYRNALRFYLKRSLKAQMPFSYKLSSIFTYAIVAGLSLEGLTGILGFFAKSSGSYEPWILIAVGTVELGIMRDWAMQLGTHRSARYGELWQEAGLRKWGSRPKMGSVSAGFKWWSFLTLGLILVPFVAGFLLIVHNESWPHIAGLLIASIAAGCSLYFTLLWLYDISFKPGSKRHVYARYRTTLGMFGAVAVPVLIFVAANWILSLF